MDNLISELEAAVKDGREEDIKEIVQKIAADTANREGVLRASEILIGKRLYKFARPVLEEAEKRFPENGQVSYWLASTDISEKDLHSAIAHMKDAKDKGFTSSEMLIDCALLYMYVGKNETAYELLRRATELSGDDPSAYILLYSEQMRLKMFKAAARSAGEIIKRRPDDYEGYHYMAAVLYSDGQYEKAMKLLREIEGAFAKNKNYILDCAAVYVMSGEDRKALDLLEEKEEALDKDAFVYLKIKGKALLNLQDDGAEPVLIELLDKHADMEAGISLAVLYMTEKRFDEAMELLGRVTEKDDSSKNYFFGLLLGVQCLNLQDSPKTRPAAEKAIARYEKALEASNTFVYVNAMEAECFRILGDNDKADRCMQIAKAAAKEA